MKKQKFKPTVWLYTGERSHGMGILEKIKTTANDPYRLVMYMSPGHQRETVDNHEGYHLWYFLSEEQIKKAGWLLIGYL